MDRVEVRYESDFVDFDIYCGGRRRSGSGSGRVGRRQGRRWAAVGGRLGEDGFGDEDIMVICELGLGSW